MPPKAKAVKEEVLDSELPDIKTTICRLNMHIKQNNIQKFLASLSKTQRLYYKIISRKDIVDFAKEKALYLDPATMTDKQKKDPAFADVPKELTDSVMANAFSLLIADHDLVAKKAKKEFDDAVAAGADPQELIKQQQNAKDTSKKGSQAAKAPVKGKKVEEVVEEEEVKEDEYERETDMIYILPDYPSTKNEFSVFGRQKTALHLLMDVDVNYTDEVVNNENVSQSEKVNKSALDKSADVDTSNVQGTDNETVIDDILMDDDDKNYIDENKKLGQFLAESRSTSMLTSGLRNACAKMISYTVNIRSLEANYDAFKDVFFKYVSDFSLEVNKFEQWCQQIKTIPLVADAIPVKEYLSKSGDFEVDVVVESKKDLKSSSKNKEVISNQIIKTEADESLQKSLIEDSIDKSVSLKAKLGRIDYSKFSGLFDKSYKVAPEHTTGATMLNCMANMFDQNSSKQKHRFDNSLSVGLNDTQNVTKNSNDITVGNIDEKVEDFNN